MITANMVKELREQTGAGMLDCKKALTETNGNMEEAVTWLREKGISKAAKKQTRIAAEGLALAKVEGNKAVIVEVNSETDFVAKNAEFVALVNNVCEAVAVNNPADLEAAKAIYNYSKDNDFYKIKGGVIEGKVMTAEEIIAIAKLPSRDTLLSMLAGALLANIQKFAVALDQVRIQKESGAETETAPVAEA